VNHTTAERSNPTAVTAVGAPATAALADGPMATIETRTPSNANSAANRKFRRRTTFFEPRGGGELLIRISLKSIEKVAHRLARQFGSLRTPLD
jgi:hypothetical protein